MLEDVTTLPTAATPVHRVLSRFDRQQLAGFIDVALDLLDLLDLADGDPDVEPNGDELDGQPAEDEFMDHGHGDGPGCSVADPDLAVDDGPCDEPDQDREPEEGI